MARARVGLLLSVLAGFLGLGTLWGVDRSRRWEAPRAEAERFTVLRGPAGVAAGRALSLVAVHLGCPHCQEALQRLPSADARRGREDLVVLLVDHDREPPAARIDALGHQRVWWDRHGIWRHRWGHRIYGEVLRFDAAGRYVGTAPPRLDPPAPRPAPPPRQGGDSE